VTIRVQVPGPLVAYADGHGEVTLDVAGSTVDDALAALFALHPRLRDRLLDEQGRLRRHVNLFLDRASIRDTGGLATPLRPGATLTVLPAVSGG
jgi:molybdopterin converting factor small subunit